MKLLDVYDDEGVPTGKVVERSTYKENLSEGEHIAVVQVYIQNKKGEFLIEKSAKTTGERYLPVSGHLISGEEPVDGMVREIKEEIGLDIDKEELEFVKFYLIDAPLRYIFYIKKDIDIRNLELQHDEVEHVEFMTTEQILYLSANGLMAPVHRGIIPDVVNHAIRHRKYK